VSAAFEVEEGDFAGGIPYVALGVGEPLVFLRGAMPLNQNPTGLSRWAELRSLKPFADQFRVYAVGHQSNPRATATMSDLVGPIARALRDRFDGPVDVVGWSTGGALALQYAIDHPDLVKRLVIGAAACRLGPLGKSVQMRYVTLLEAGRRRDAARSVTPLFTKSPLAEAAVGWVMWLTAPLEGPIDVPDLTAVMRAEDRFDAEADLHRIKAPTLVIAGDDDRVYPLELARLTTNLIPNAQLITYEHAGHTQVLEDSRLVQDVTTFLQRERIAPTGLSHG
jgi:pimeloyl-ACP methyl ester carboxylesterase